MRVSNLLLSVALVVSAFAFLPAGSVRAQGKGVTPPLVIDPSVSPLADAYAVKQVKGRTFFVSGDAEGEEWDTDSAVGYTRTGKRTKSAILCDPGPADALRLTVSDALEEQGLLAESAKDASFVIDVKADLRLAEETRTLHQAIVATLKIEVSVWPVSDASRVKKFKMEAVGERKTFDTTKKAVEAAREAVRSAAQEILKSLDSL